jgi:pimeloyl-ACP methyl ester carboxylesterase
MYRKVETTIYLCLVLAFLLSLPAWAVTGLALVHGKGSSDLANQQTANEYWGSDMIKAASKNYQYPYVVAHYDGTQYMWQAAGQVAGQLYDFIDKNNISDLVVVTHSFGGIVMRWIFSNPDYDSRYKKIIQVTRCVNTIAAPAKGSEAADMADELSGSWLTGWIVDIVGQNTDATRNCTTSKMAEYNSTKLFGTPGRPALPKTFRWVSGYGLWNDMTHSEDYGLAMLSGAAGMPGEDDGAVSEYSAQAVGQKWFRTEANHHHNRRNDFEKIGDAIGNDVAQRIADRAEPDVRFSGVVQAGNDKEAYRAFSTRYIEFIPMSAEKTSCDIPVLLEDSEHAHVVVWPLHQMQRGEIFTLALDNKGQRGMQISDSKNIEMDGTEMSLPQGGQCLVIAQATRGEYPLRITTARSAQTRMFAVVVNSESKLTLQFSLSSLYGFDGMPLDICATLRDGTNPITGAQVTVDVAREGSKEFARITLNDDGMNGDARANDGVYATRATIGRNFARETGDWLLRVFASGVNGSGQRFQRSAKVYFQHCQRSGEIHKPVHEEALYDSAHKLTQLGFSVPVAIYQPGRYRLLGTLYVNASDGSLTPIAWTMDSRQIANTSQKTYELMFPGEDIGNTSGPFHLKLELFSLDRIEMAAEPLEGYWTKSN